MNQMIAFLDSNHLYYSFSIIVTLSLLLSLRALYTHPLNIIIGMMGRLLPLISPLESSFILLLSVSRGSDIYERSVVLPH